MRILLDCRMASWSGVGRYTRGLARALAAREDVELVQAVPRGEKPPVTEGAASVIELGSGHPFTALGARALGAAAAGAAPDVVHSPHFPTPLPAPHPLVVTIHDLSPLLVDGLMPSAARRTVYAWWNRRAARVADAVVCDSAHTAADWERFVRARAAARAGVVTPATVIPLAADDFSEGVIGALPEWLTEASGTSDAPRYILSMGNTKPHKDLPTLLRAFSRLAVEDSDLQLLLVGRDVPGYAAGVLDAGDSALARIRFTDTVDDGSLRALYAKAAVFAFPSRYEGYGLPPLEAMAAGTPVVCAAAASLPEVVGDAALLVPPGDPAAFAAALRTVLTDPAERARLAAAGPVRAHEFTWAATAAATVAVYERVMADTTRKPGT